MVAPRALNEFIAEANELLETLGRELLGLEQHGLKGTEPEKLNATFRTAHSLKGLAALFGFESFARLAHRAEDLLDALRLGKVQDDQSLLDTLGKTVDLLQAMLAKASRGDDSAELNARAEALGEELARLAAHSSQNAAVALELAQIAPQLRAVLTEYEEHRLRENIKMGVSLWKVRVALPLDSFDTRLARLNSNLKPVGEIISTLPSSPSNDPHTIGFELLLGSAHPRLELERMLIEGASLEPLMSARLGVVPPGPFSSASSVFPMKANESSLRSLTNTVRVDIGRLDGLMNSIGELLLIRSNIERIAEVARQVSGPALPKLWGQDLQREVRALQRRLDEMQKRVLDVRMVPLGQVFDKLARLMRRLVRESGKEVSFEVSGGDVELDKLIVEELSDPLMHLLRNALDHGTDRPELRFQQGKSARATIGLVARQQGNHVIIEVRDDGLGLDEGRIREVAVERGLVTAEQLEEMDRRELHNLVFRPGFSTRRDVSELSGRGVGLDVVKTNLQRLSGLIDITSLRGKGTTFTLTLPLTLAIIRALMVSVSGRIYAIPLNAVLEIVSVRTEAIRTIERREVIVVRGQTLPLIRLARVFGLPEEAREVHFVVLIGLAQQRLGLAIDELLSQQDIVTKPLSGRLGGIPGISGATELGDRRAVLVLDIGALMEELLHTQTM